MTIKRLEKTLQILIFVHITYFILISLSFFLIDVKSDDEAFNALRYIFIYAIDLTIYHILFLIQALNEANTFQLKFSFVFLFNLILVLIGLIITIIDFYNFAIKPTISLMICCVLAALEIVLLSNEISKWSKDFKSLYYIKFGGSYMVKSMWQALLIKKPIWFANNFV